MENKNIETSNLIYLNHSKFLEEKPPTSSLQRKKERKGRLRRSPGIVLLVRVSLSSSVSSRRKVHASPESDEVAGKLELHEHEQDTS